MLIEIRCDKFRTGVVEFHSGLNVILGDDNATNSIGKSTLLMVIDFVLGGDSLLTHNKDLVRELGHHDYFFTFRFEDSVLRYRRGTFQPEVVYTCDENFGVKEGISVSDFAKSLMNSYRIDLPDLTFRALVGLYLRVWGKENLSVERPLHAAQAQPASECVDNLIKVFGKYGTLSELSSEVSRAEAKKKAFSAATRESILPTVKKRDYEANKKRIDELQSELADIRTNLAKYATNLSELVNREVLELKLEKDRLLALRLPLGGRLQRVDRNLRAERVVRSESFTELTRFFPNVNKERLAQVEDFHSGVAKLLRAELAHSKTQIEREIGRIDEAIRHVDEEMSTTLVSVEQPSKIVDRVVEVAVALTDATEKNERFDAEARLRSELKRLHLLLIDEKQKVLSTVQNIVNDGMRRIVSSVFGEDRKSPRITLKEKSYEFEVDDDTGTGTAYASLVVFDLTVFTATLLPVIAHDTLLFKNIENDSVAALVKVYMETDKQSFVALDEIEKYGPATAELLRQRSVIQLDDNHVLYTKDWRNKTNQGA